MKDKVLYALVYGWVKLHALLPFPVLYFLSDLLYLLVYYIVRYRVRVVRRNLKASFPEKTEEERRRIERKFYRHFTDYIVESIKLAHFPAAEALKRAPIRNPEMVDQLSAGEHTCVVMYMGHYGNWEWFTSANLSFLNSQLFQIYRPLKSPAIDRLFIHLRSRYGAIGIKKNDTVRKIIELEKSHTRSTVAFLSDQTPSKANIHYWTSFLNQDSPFFTGAERIARKLDLPVIYLDIRKVKRGYYEGEFKLIAEHARETPEFELTEQYVRLMEESILREPAYWLWSHKRWKHKRDDA